MAMRRGVGFASVLAVVVVLATLAGGQASGAPTAASSDIYITGKVLGRVAGTNAALVPDHLGVQVPRRQARSGHVRLDAQGRAKAAAAREDDDARSRHDEVRQEGRAAVTRSVPATLRSVSLRDGPRCRLRQARDRGPIHRAGLLRVECFIGPRPRRARARQSREGRQARVDRRAGRLPRHAEGRSRHDLFRRC